MKYRKIKKGKFIERPNRFIAYVNVEGEENNPQIVHVKNTGRCKELLVDNATVFLEESDNPNRKTKYDLVKVIKNGILTVSYTHLDVYKRQEYILVFSSLMIA